MNAYHKRGCPAFRTHVARFVKGDYREPGTFQAAWPRRPYHGEMTRHALIQCGLLASCDRFTFGGNQ